MVQPRSFVVWVCCYIASDITIFALIVTRLVLWCRCSKLITIQQSVDTKILAGDYNITMCVTADSKKHGMTESSAEHSAEPFSKTSEMVPNGLNIPMYES